MTHRMCHRPTVAGSKVADLACVWCRKYVIKVLASQLRPELEEVVKKNTLAPGEAYSPAAEQV